MTSRLDDRRLAVGLSTCFVFGFSLYLSRFVDAPFMFHDEFGYVAVGRIFGPGPPPELYGPLYHPAYGMLLAPFDYLISSGALLHRVALTINAAFVASIVPILYLIGCRIAALEHWSALAAAVAGASTAAVLTTAQMLVAESMLVALTALSVLVVHWWLTMPNSFARAFTAGAVIGVAYMTHPRSLALGLGLGVCCLVGLGIGLVRVRNVAAAMASLALFGITTRLINSVVVSTLYPFGTTADVAGVDLVRLILDQPLLALKSAIGTIWYATASTLGLAPLGILALVAGLRRSAPSGFATGLYLLTGAASSLGLSVVLVSYSLVDDPARSDFALYGRYIEQWVPLGIVFACSLRLRQLRTMAPFVLAFMLGGLFVLRTRYDESLWDRPAALHNVAGVTAPRHFNGRFDLADDGLWFVIGTALVLAVASTRGVRWLALPCALLGLTTSYFLITDWASTASENAAVRHRNGDVLDDDTPIAVNLTATSSLYLYNLQYWNDGLDLDLSRGVPLDNSVTLGRLTAVPALQSRLLSVEPFSDRALWITDSDLIAELDAAGDLFPQGFEDDPTLPPEAAFAATRLTSEVEDSISLRQTRMLSVEVTHAGSTSPWVTAWSDQPVRVATRLWNDTTNTVVAETRAEIYETVTPGDSIVAEIELPVAELLDDTDTFSLEVGVVQERVAWLSPPPGTANPRLPVTRN